MPNSTLAQHTRACASPIYVAHFSWYGQYFTNRIGYFACLAFSHPLWCLLFVDNLICLEYVEQTTRHAHSSHYHPFPASKFSLVQTFTLRRYLGGLDSFIGSVLQHTSMAYGSQGFSPLSPVPAFSFFSPFSFCWLSIQRLKGRDL